MGIVSRPQTATAATIAETATVLVSFELSQERWVLTLRQPGSMKQSRFSVPAGDTGKVLSLLRMQREQAERRGGRAVRMVSIYEAGRDGFWLHRWLRAGGVESYVVDPASILGPQRRRNAKTDRIDGERLLRSLAAWLGGEKGVCAMVVAPSVAEEDRRRLSRERDEQVTERTRLCNRINGLLATQGIFGFQPMRKPAREMLGKLRTGDGHALPTHLRRAIERVLERIDLLQQQIKTVEKERDALLTAASAGTDTRAASSGRMLLRLRGIGPEFATVLPLECFYRRFANRRQVAAYAGLVPTPW